MAGPQAARRAVAPMVKARLPWLLWAVLIGACVVAWLAAFLGTLTT